MVTHAYRFLKPPPRGGFFVSAPCRDTSIPILYWLAALLLLVSLSAAAQPKLVLPDGASFEFGEIIAGARPTHAITIENGGSDTLRIQNVTVQCHCSTTRLSRDVIPPGETGVLYVTFESDLYVGRVGKSLSIVSNDPHQMVVLVEFTADVRTYLDVAPKVIVFSHDESVAMAPKTILLTNRDTVAIRILSVVDSAFLVVAAKPGISIRPGKNVLYPLIPKTVGEASAAGTLELQTDNRRQPVVRLRYIIEGSGKRR